MGFLTAKSQLKDGIVCDTHLEALSINDGGFLEIIKKQENLLKVSLEDVKEAVYGDSSKWDQLRRIVYDGVPSNEDKSLSDEDSETPLERQPKKRESNMLIVNTESIPGKNLKLLGLVKGSVFADGAIEPEKIYGHGYFGGEYSGDTTFDEAYAEVNGEMEEEAEALNADAIINVRYSVVGMTSTDVRKNETSTMLFAIGTAVRFI